MKNDFDGGSLAAFAYVYDSYKSSGDVGLGLANLFRPVIAHFKGQVFDPNKISARFQEVYGLEVYPIAVEGLLHHFERLRLVRKMEADPRTGESYHHCTAEVANSETEEASATFEQMLSEFSTHANQALQKAGLEPIADSQLRKDFLSRLTQVQFLEATKQNERNFYIGDTLTLETPKNDPPDIEKIIEVLVAQFLMEALDRGATSAERLIAVMNGALLAEVVLTLLIEEDHEGLADVTLWLDAPILLDLLNQGAEEDHTYSTQLLSLMNSAGARKMTFDHSVEEAKNVLTTVLDRVSRGHPVFGPLGRKFALDPGAVSSSRLTLTTFDQKVEGLGIEERPAPDVKASPELEQYFSEANKDRLRNALGEIHVEVDRRERDAQSVAAIIRSRGTNRRPRSIVEASHVLVTRNVGLQRLSTKQLARDGLVTPPNFPACITDRQLAGILWLTVGGEISDLNKEKLIGRCMAALDPNINLVSKVLQVLHEHGDSEEVIEEFKALMLDERARNCLVIETLGWSSLVNEDRIRDLLRRIRESTAKEERKKAEDEIRQIEEKHSSKLHQLESGRTWLESAVDLRDQQISRHRKESELERAARSERTARRRKKFRAVARFLSGAVYLLILLVAYWADSWLTEVWFLSFILLELIVVVLFAKSLRPRLENWIYNKILEFVES